MINDRRRDHPAFLARKAPATSSTSTATSAGPAKAGSVAPLRCREGVFSRLEASVARIVSLDS